MSVSILSLPKDILKLIIEKYLDGISTKALFCTCKMLSSSILYPHFPLKVSLLRIRQDDPISSARLKLKLYLKRAKNEMTEEIISITKRYEELVKNATWCISCDRVCTDGGCDYNYHHNSEGYTYIECICDSNGTLSTLRPWYNHYPSVTLVCRKCSHQFIWRRNTSDHGWSGYNNQCIVCGPVCESCINAQNNDDDSCVIY